MNDFIKMWCKMILNFLMKVYLKKEFVVAWQNTIRRV